MGRGDGSPILSESKSARCPFRPICARKSARSPVGSWPLALAMYRDDPPRPFVIGPWVTKLGVGNSRHASWGPAEEHEKACGKVSRSLRLPDGGRGPTLGVPLAVAAARVERRGRPPSSWDVGRDRRRYVGLESQIGEARKKSRELRFLLGFQVVEIRAAIVHLPELTRVQGQ